MKFPAVTTVQRTCQFIGILIYVDCFVTKLRFIRLTSEITEEEVIMVEKAAFEKLYRTYYMRVYSYVMALAGKTHMAEEITQETFYKAFTTNASFRGDSNAMTWLCAIARNLFIDEMRRQSKSAESIPPDADADSGVNIEREVEDKDTSYQIHQALHELEEPYRKVFELRIFGEMSFREISEICGKTESWARVTYHRAKLKLMERMDIHETQL